MKKYAIIIFLLLTALLSSQQLLTVAEKSNYTKTSLYRDVMDFIMAVQKLSPKIKVQKLTTSTEGRLIPLVVVSEEGINSPYELKALEKPVVLIMANIHAGEVEGKEATLMLLREFAENKLTQFLKNQIVLILPIFNADGNEKLGKNRRDNGPELAGTRANGQNLDLNRDYMKMDSPEIKALVKLFCRWDPVVIVDMHTTNGSYHQEPVTFSTLTNPNTSKKMQDYMWFKLFPRVVKILKDKYGYDGVAYGNFIDRRHPEKGWRNHAFDAHYGSNYGGLRNRFTILNENYSHADFKTRVLASFGFIKAILEYTHTHIRTMEQMVQQVDRETANSYHNREFVLRFNIEKLFDLTLKSYVFKTEKIKPEDRDKYPPWIRDYVVKKTDTLKNYRLPYLAKATPKRSIALPEGYIILPHQTNILQNLKRHGIVVEKFTQPVKLEAEQFVIKETKLAKRIYQGHVQVSVQGEYKPADMTIPRGSFFVSMRQPLARLVAELLEPEGTSALIRWGFFNRRIVRQWSRNPGTYPVYRLHKISSPLPLIQD